MFKYYRPTEDGCECLVCPRRCVLRDGQRGYCRVRGNENSAVKLLDYGVVSSIAVEPIEKKPFFHFFDVFFISVNSLL